MGHLTKLKNAELHPVTNNISLSDFHVGSLTKSNS